MMRDVSRAGLWIVSFSILFVLMSVGNGASDIYALDEAKNAEAAREIMLSNDKITPVFNGSLRSDKPPLHYYAMIAAYKALGVSPFAARLFSTIMGVLTILMVVVFLFSQGMSRAAWMAGAILLSSVHFHLQMRMAVPDPFLICFITAGGVAWYFLYNKGGVKCWFLYYLMAGLGLLTKGPISLAIHGLAAVIFLLLRKDFRWSTIWRLQPFLGVVLALLVAAPWYIAVHNTTSGQFTQEFFLGHNLDRFSSEFEGHGGFFLITVAYSLLVILPLLGFLFDRKVWRLSFSGGKVVSQMALSYVLAIVGFFMLSSTRLPNYTAPAYPFIAILVGGYLFQLGNKKVTIGLWISAVIALALTVGGYFGMMQDDLLKDLRLLTGVFIIPMLSAIVALFAIRTSDIRIYTMLGGWLLACILIFGWIMPTIDKKNPVRLSQHLFEGIDNIHGYGIINRAYVFKLERIIPIHNDVPSLRAGLLPNGESLVVSRKGEREEDLLRLGGEKIFESRDLFESSTTVIYKFESKK